MGELRRRCSGLAVSSGLSDIVRHFVIFILFILVILIGNDAAHLPHGHPVRRHVLWYQRAAMVVDAALTSFSSWPLAVITVQAEKV
jgi:hypothetical protein